MVDTHTSISRKKNELIQKKEEERREREKENENMEIKKKHILVIDDDPMMLKLVNEQLHERYNVATAISGKLALSFLEKKQTDLILLDYEMPEMNGKEVLERMQADEELNDIPVAFLTSVDTKDVVVELLALKPAGYLLKPVESQALLKKVFEVIGK